MKTICFFSSPKWDEKLAFPAFVFLPSQLPNLNYFYTLPLLIKLIVRHANLHWDGSYSLRLYRLRSSRISSTIEQRVSVSSAVLGPENRRDTDRILKSILPEVRIRPGMTKQSSPSHWLRSCDNGKHSILEVGKNLRMQSSINNNNRYIPECGEHATDVATQVLHSVLIICRVVEELPVS
jgi:hypothetical protein